MMERIAYIPGAGWCWSSGYAAQARYCWRTALLGYHGVNPNHVLDQRPGSGQLRDEFLHPWKRMETLGLFMGSHA